MNETLAVMERFYMALADTTRLRILNLMRNGEVCVNDLSTVLGDSQPKISRHLAYLRQAGVVKTRRDGKWIYYSILQAEDKELREVLNEALNWLESVEEAQAVGAFADPIANDFISALPYVMETETKNNIHIAHNELEEFLL